KALCDEFNVECRPPRGGGSHYRIGHPSQVEKLTPVAARPIKARYIRDLVRFIDKVRAAP
ncbi:type II toxin-antitoxin system HicA family toxin, partial [uncultured Methylobacterium sp.]|uniref:type II toxin-antitoxin system HicA family toxin n=1 Tax=uncultured Methylobacterium sp. TaxID=157278 RepID=UPI0035CADEC2